MQIANPRRTLGAVEFVATAASQRAASYRETAVHLSALADAEPIGRLRAQLLDLADQYGELAGSLEISGPNKGPFLGVVKVKE
jgi:hypothetical protein